MMNRLMWVALLAACTEPPALPADAGSVRWLAVRAADEGSRLEVPARVIGGPLAVTWVSACLLYTSRCV